MLTEPNQLMIAAERGDSNAVNLCLKSGFNVNEKVNGRTAADLAWNNQHFEIVLNLLMANSQFPVDFQTEMATDGIKDFKDMTNKLHEHILKGNTAGISEILQDNPDLRHFYSIKNVSAPAYALRNKKFKVYEFLIANNVFIGLNENVDEIYKELSKSRCKDLKKIHLKYLKHFKESHLIVLTINSNIVSEFGDAVNKLEVIRNAYTFLEQVDPLMSLILQIVAASRDFKVIFDFDSSVTEIKVNKEVNKVREFRVQAQGLLDPVQQLSVHESMAREFCIYAMELVYNNYGRPYTSTDDQTRKIFNKISTICEASRGKEELIDSLYSNKTDMYHAKLMALVPQMMVKYAKDPVRMEECRANFSELFKFSQEVIEPELQHKLPTIKSLVEQKAQKIQTSNKRQLKVMGAIIFLMPFAILLAVILTKPYIEPIYSCENLTDELRSKIFESTVEFQGVNVIFGDLFGRNSTACEHLSPQEVTGMLKVFDSGKFVENYTGIYVNFTAEEIKMIANKASHLEPRDDLSLIQELNGEELIKELTNIESKEYTNIRYMNKKFRVASLKISQAVDLRTKFYVPRIMTINHMYTTTKYKRRLAKYIGFLKLSSTKLFLLADNGGSGKSTYFRHMTWKLKRRFPLKWISYVDLKQHIHVLQDVPKTDANLTTVVDFLSSKLFNLTSKLEIGVFERKFLSNESVLLWDGVDEVSPTYYNETLRLVEIVRNLTGNKQWISTRLHLEKKIVAKFKVQPYKLDEFIEEDKLEFIEKFLDTNGIKNQNLSRVVAKVDEYLTKINTIMVTDIDSIPISNETNPRMLSIICNAYIKNIQKTAKLNLYTIYEDYFLKVFEDVVMAKGEVVKDDVMIVTERGEFKRFHQQIAASYQADKLYGKDNADGTFFVKEKWEIFKNPSTFDDEKFMRFGILYKKHARLVFEHVTFREFFTAQFFFDNIWRLSGVVPRDDEIMNRLNLLFYTIQNCQSINKNTCDFIIEFIDAYSDKNDNSFNKYIKSTVLQYYSDLRDVFSSNVYGIEVTTRFFMKDNDIINAMWKLDQNRTFFHEFFEMRVTPIEMEQMTELINKVFSPEVRLSIIKGKHQAGNLLRLAWQKKSLKRYLKAYLNAVNFSCDVEALIKIGTFKDFMDYFEAQNFTREELMEFFKINFDKTKIYNENNKAIFREYAKKLLTAQDFTEVSKVWGY